MLPTPRPQRMEQFQPSYFFDLAHFKHASLFEECRHVWEVFPKIAEYLKRQALGKIETFIPPGAHIVHPELISIGKGSVIEPGAYIKGPCIIGEKCTIRHGAYIRGDVIAGDGCVIGHDTETKNAVFLNEAHAAHFAYVGDSILGNKVNLGAGTKCANLKLDKTTIVIHHEGFHYATGLRKFGAIIGDGTQLGCNCVTNPGTLIGKNVVSYPCLNFGGVILTNSVVRSEAKISISSKSKSRA